MVRKHLKELQAHPFGGKVLLLQQAFNGFYQVQVFHGVLPAIGMSASRFEKLLEGLFPIAERGFAHPRELGDLFDGEHQILGGIIRLHEPLLSAYPIHYPA
jgi:hypothetical protein